MVVASGELAGFPVDFSWCPLNECIDGRAFETGSQFHEYR